MSIEHNGGCIVHFRGPSATEAMHAQDSCTASKQHAYQYGIFTVRHAMNEIQRKIMKRVQIQYTDRIIMETLIPLLGQTNAVSLRLLDYLVTNYGREKPVYLKQNGNIESVYHMYKRNLQMWKRRNFDPFRRSQRCVDGQVTRYIVEFTSNGTLYTTTVGQLNFILFAVESGVLSYAQSNRGVVEKAMNARGQNLKRRRATPSVELASFPHRTTVDFQSSSS